MGFSILRRSMFERFGARERQTFDSSWACTSETSLAIYIASTHITNCHSYRLDAIGEYELARTQS